MPSELDPLGAKGTQPRMGYRYYICDVFTDTRFGGNQLAVLPNADGLSDQRMQQIAREFNFSETTFVFPPESGHTRKVRIFTPTAELPFAGHPNIGTAFVLATAGEFGDIETSITVTFEEKAGLVPIDIQKHPGRPLWSELAAPESLTLGKTIAVGALASAVSLAEDDIVTTTHLPQVASVGLPFLLAELTDRDSLERARPNIDGLDALVAEGVPPDVHLYTHSADEFDIRARMFAPLDNIPEDPATGSANCALAGLLCHYDVATDSGFRWRIAQGVEMGRPSLLEARAEKRDGIVVDTWIGGTCVLVSEGVLEVD
jgi:trans-2,3-dihydro-3-hydroxyanthranilate isomerase